MTEIPIKNRTHRNIGGVKLIHTGLKGIEITYETIEIQNGVSYTSEDIKKSKRPVHTSLKDLVKELKPYFIELLGYSAYADYEDLNKFEVTGVKAGTDRFIITGMHQCWQDKTMGMATPQIKEADEYERYDEVMKVIDSIYKETDLYIQGVKNIKREEVIVDFMKDVRKKSEFDFSDFENMTPEEQEELMKEIEKDTGISVHEENGEMVITASEESDKEVYVEINNGEMRPATDFEKRKINGEVVIGNKADFDDSNDAGSAQSIEEIVGNNVVKEIQNQKTKIATKTALPSGRNSKEVIEELMEEDLFVDPKKGIKQEVKPIDKNATKEEKLKYAKEVEAKAKSKVKNLLQEEEELPVSFDDNFDLPL